MARPKKIQAENELLNPNAHIAETFVMDSASDKPTDPIKRKTLEALFNEPCAIAVRNTLMHQAFQIPGAGTESSLSCDRPRLKGLKLAFHPGYGLIGYLGGKYFLAPSANVIVVHEA